MTALISIHWKSTILAMLLSTFSDLAKMKMVPLTKSATFDTSPNQLNYQRSNKQLLTQSSEKLLLQEGRAPAR